jgi:hypothetical protein
LIKLPYLQNSITVYFVRPTLLTFIVLTLLACGDKNPSKEGYVSPLETVQNDSGSVYKPNLNTSAIQLETVEDTIRYHLGISDSLKILSLNYYGSTDPDEHIRLFVDYNANSIFHEAISSDYGCDCIDTAVYNSVYNRAYHQFRDSIRVDYKKYKQFFGDWIPIELYHNEFYLERILCEFNRHGFTLSDSALVQYSMDGPYPSLLLGIEESGRDIIIKTSEGQHKLKRMDIGDEIYLYEDRYLIHKRNLHSYPIIVTDCHEVGATLRTDDL